MTKFRAITLACGVTILVVSAPTWGNTPLSPAGSRVIDLISPARAPGMPAKSLGISSIPPGQFSVHSASGFTININASPGLAGNAAALAAFNRAAQQWSNRFSDPITVTIDADLASLGPGIIGSSSAVILGTDYDTIRDQMVADAADEPSNAIVAHLPTNAGFTASLPAGVSLDGNLILSKANAKAMGFTGLDGAFGATDASITFSTNFNFDYDNSNGVDFFKMDFETVASHEIGHALGFLSSVDDIDDGATTVSPTTLDLFRFANSAKPTNSANFTTLARSLRPGIDEVTSDVDSAWRMSTGISGGDGRQASHWKDDDLTGVYLGIMDPTLNFGTVELPTDADFRAFDLIGYDLVPEPGMGGAIMVAAAAIRRRRRGSSPDA